MQRCVVFGLVRNVSERAAWKLFQPYLDRVNAEAKSPPKSGITLECFVKEWRSSVAVNLKGSTTRAAESHLRAQISEVGQSSIDGDKHEDGSKLRGISGLWTDKENSRERAANSLFHYSRSKNLGLCLRRFHADRHHHAA